MSVLLELTSKDKDKIGRAKRYTAMPGGKTKRLRNAVGLGAAKGNGRRPSRRAEGYPPPHHLLVFAARTIMEDLASEGLSTDFLATAHPSESANAYSDGPRCPYTGERKPRNGVVKSRSACGRMMLIVEYKDGVVFSAHARPV